MVRNLGLGVGDCWLLKGLGLHVWASFWGFTSSLGLLPNRLQIRLRGKIQGVVSGPQKTPNYSFAIMGGCQNYGPSLGTLTKY